MKLVSALSVVALSMISTAAFANPSSIIYVSGPKGLDQFLEQGFEGAKKAAAELGASIKDYESANPTEDRQTLEAAAKSGADIVVTITFEYDDILPDVAKAYPNTKFIQIDSCPKESVPNIFCVQYREQEATFLAGAEAALTTKTNKVGAIGAIDVPLLRRYTDGFAAGAKYANPNVTVVPTLWVGGDTPFTDPARGEQRAAAMLQGGVDRFLAAAAGSNVGMFNALPDFPGATAFGVDVNECPKQPGYVQDNVLKRTDVAAYDSIIAVAAGNAQNKTELGVKENGVSLTALQDGLADSQCEIAKSPDIVTKLKEIAAKIESGEIKVADPSAN